MKYACTLWLLIGMLILAPNRSTAQATLGMYTTSVSSSTPNVGDQLSVYTMLKNYSLTDTFTGTINFLLANKDSIITNVNIVGKPAFTGTVITLAPQQTRPALFTVQLAPSYFMAGPDIIIVWPVAAVQTIDSAKAPITIGSATGISDIETGGVHSYISNEQLIIDNVNPQNRLQQVQIYDLTGRKVAEYAINTPAASIPVQNLPKGIYLARIICNDGENKVMKFAR